ncbi:MFS general substrate transporter [Aureobasidium subglaciale]|nr:MFS general substrate transporter [Aureobasidium subglaciale]
MHRQQYKSGHLRQRSNHQNGDITRPDREGTGSPYGSPYIREEEESYFERQLPAQHEGSNSGPTTPRTLEAGSGTTPGADVSPGPGTPSKPAMPPRSSSLKPFQLKTDVSRAAQMPAGATTPLDNLPTPGLVTYPPEPATWRNMPNKGQLALLAASRFVDFFQMAALQTYMVHQLKSFDRSQPDSVISHQAGMLQGSFTAAQIITSILWGRAADQPGVGRKLVLNIGMIGTAIGCIGVGFSTSFHQAVMWRVLSGAINGTVGAARTMVAECTDKRWHPRAFLLLPAAFNVANVLGPILSGLLADPVTAYPHLFGPNSTFGGAEGIAWMKNHPYAAPNLLCSLLLVIEALLCTCFLDETLKGFTEVDVGAFNPVTIARGVWNRVHEVKNKGYKLVGETAMSRRGLLSGREEGSIELDRIADANETRERQDSHATRPMQRLPFRRVWTSNVCWTLLSIAIFDFHMGAFSTLWILFLSTSREFVPGSTTDGKPQKQERGAFKFGGGLAFPPPTIGYAMAIIGFVGIILQFVLYPRANARFGLMRCFRSSLFLFPLAYFLAPYIALMPSDSASPAPASGFWVWLGIGGVVFLQVAARTFALPASILLLNNSSPHPSVLATIHGLGQADSALFRTIGPILSASWYGTWLERGVVGMAWWYVAAISALGTAAAFKVRNGNGHEILLPGEEERADEQGHVSRGPAEPARK